MAADKNYVMSVRVPKPLAEALRQVAFDNRRSVGTQINIVLEEGLKALKIPLPAGLGRRRVLRDGARSGP